MGGMNEPPADLLAMLPPAAVIVAKQWWDSLTESDRAQLTELWDNRLETRFFSPQLDSDGRRDRWDQVPSVTGGKFIPPDDARGFSEWGLGHFEYLLAHPELVIVHDPTFRTFHIGGFSDLPSQNALPNS